MKPGREPVYVKEGTNSLVFVAAVSDQTFFITILGVCSETQGVFI